MLTCKGTPMTALAVLAVLVALVAIRWVTTPSSLVNRLTGTEAWTDPINLPSGSTMNGRAIAGSGAGVVDTTATTLSVTATQNAGKVLTISTTAAIAISLPPATGTGDSYKFVIEVAATATSSTIKAAGSDVMQGVAWALTTASANVIGYPTTATSNTISLNGTTLGGVVGDFIELTDIKTGIWSVKIFDQPTGSTATPFSHS
jgi:hypothetical protein